MPTSIFYPICGNCLHAHSNHSDIPYNPQIKYCSACMKLCETEDFKVIHKPTSTEIMYAMQAKRSDK